MSGRLDVFPTGFDLPAVLNYIVPERASDAIGRVRWPEEWPFVNKHAFPDGYENESVMETAVESPECSLPREVETVGKVETTAMKQREFDFDSLVRPIETRMMRSIWRIVRQREAAEDALQDALTIIWRKRETVARHPNPQALILKISINAAYDAVRKSRRRLRREVAGLPEKLPDDSSSSVSKESEDRTLLAEVLEAIGSLPKRQATAVLMRIVEEKSYEEIARGMGCSETTARIHVMRARAALTNRLAHFHPGLVDGGEEGEKETVS